MSPRPDGRKLDELRPLRVTRNYTKHTAGSVLMEYGDTRILVTATVEERIPRHVQHQEGDSNGWLTAEYAMLPGATNTRTQRERQKLSGRTSEIQRLIGRSLRASIDLSRLGERTITIDCDVLQADGGTRVAAITGGFIALMDAMNKLKEDGLLKEIPLVSPVAAVSVGIIDGEAVLDLNYEEDSSADVDANIVMNKEGKFIEIQFTSEGEAVDRKVVDQLLDSGEKGIRQLIEFQEAMLGINEKVSV